MNTQTIKLVYAYLDYSQW